MHTHCNRVSEKCTMVFSLHVELTEDVAQLQEILLTLSQVATSVSLSSCEAVLELCATKLCGSSPQSASRPSNQSLCEGANDFLQHSRDNDVLERNVTRIKFEEYCGRKLIRQEETEQWVTNFAAQVIQNTSRRYKDAILVVEISESSERQKINDAYYSYVDWIQEKMAGSYDDALLRTKQREKQQAEYSAAKRAVEAELVRNQASEASRRKEMIAAIHRDEEAVTMAMSNELRRLADEERRLNEAIAQREARKQAEEMQRRAIEDRQKQLKCDQLAAAEAALRQKMDSHNSARLAEAKRIEDERRMLLEHCAAEEEILKRRLREKELAAQQEENRKKREQEMYLEHCRAEEELLRERLRRKSMAEAADKEREKAQLLEHCRAEEELLRQRMAERERLRAQEELSAKEAQRLLLEHCIAEETALKSKLATNEQRAREVTLMRLNQEELLLSASIAKEGARRSMMAAQEEQHRQMEKARELQFLKEQEELLRLRLGNPYAVGSIHTQPPQHHMQQYCDPNQQFSGFRSQQTATAPPYYS